MAWGEVVGTLAAARARDDVVGDFPTGFVGIGDRHSQTVFRFETVCE